MKYNLTIKDNETGEVIKNHDFDAMFAGVHIGERSVAISIAETNSLGILAALDSTRKAMTQALIQHPELALLLPLLDTKKLTKEDAEAEEPTEFEGD